MQVEGAGASARAGSGVNASASTSEDCRRRLGVGAVFFDSSNGNSEEEDINDDHLALPSFEGSALYPSIALSNHSCRHSCVKSIGWVGRWVGGYAGACG